MMVISSSQTLYFLFALLHPAVLKFKILLVSASKLLKEVMHAQPTCFF